MDSLNIYIEINGQMTKVGMILGTDCNEASFEYDSEYLCSVDARPISISLPLQKQAFSPKRTKAYFESLLPEGFSRRAVAEWVKVNEDDYISILECLGRECIGAIQVKKEEKEEICGYSEISESEIEDLAKEGALKSTELLVESHISLGGATGKVGLYYDEKNKKWYKPFGTAASTHIVKQSHIRLEQLVLNEQLCMMTASKLNIDVPESFIIRFDNTEEFLYAIKRYDRLKKADGCEICSPYRLHQEDFAQALGIPASYKYESEDRQYLKKMFRLINDYSSNPIEDGLKLWDRVVFNYLIGNTDAHIKNYGILYSANFKSVRLAPAYDIICTRIYGNGNEMSVRINKKSDCLEVTRDDFKEAAKELNIGNKIAMEHFDYIYMNLQEALNKSSEELKEQGFAEAGILGKKILAASMVNV